jgi:Domain of unknown function (DUF4145)
MVSVGENWNCLYCGHAQVIADERLHGDLKDLYVTGWENGEAGYCLESIVCANNQCRKMSLSLALVEVIRNIHDDAYESRRTVKSWTLLPSSSAKPQPDYIPAALRCDYEEACAIRDLSPKASATIIRRCIQGIIRDFCGITKSRLIDEIKELRRRVDVGEAPAGVQIDTVDAIDHVRQIGNIGAHMETDINVIVDVDPGEAQALIDLTELLFEEWYVSRKIRKQRLEKLGVIAGEKNELKKQKQMPASTQKLSDGTK